MNDICNKFRIILFINIFYFIGTVGWSQELNFKVAGDNEKGFRVDIYSGSQLLIQNTEEFSLKIANLDLSETVTIPAWKGSKWTGDERIDGDVWRNHVCRVALIASTT